ncbi:hypothetical protein LCM10_03390 [Rossellomorea aquimaris]|uniref:hypothetical protein n=1 Tax=Rossellomorea aquimaris TaxID=189382 RepID=UPI001CD2E8E4|nr:hypothetical protein [Rossellomorea aquimaris]MCA1054020.1 hypothetical protein [Rossellomorea aquimaris]
MKKMSIILGIITLLFILANITKIASHARLYSFKHSKITTTETKILSANQLFDIIHQQMKLREKLESKRTYKLINDEIIKGDDELRNAYASILDTTVTKVKVSLPVTTYEDHNMTIEFVSGNGELLEIFENGEWKDFNGSWDDLFERNAQ